jgi:hypothetical protein
MTTVAAFGSGQAARAGAARPSLSRGAIGTVLFLLIAFILLAAGAVTGAPKESGAPVETGAFVVDSAMGPARG